MWKLRIPRASRVSLRRYFTLLTATLVVAVFATISLSRPVMAADATWDGTTLKYENNTYAKVTSPPDRQGEAIEYQWINNSVTPPKATVIYFETGILDTGNEFRDAHATLITYDLNGTTYSNPSTPQTINVTRDLTAPNTGENQTVGSTCDGSVTGGIGWILCPISNWIADGIDSIYSLIANFLEVVPMSDNNSGIYQLWDVVRTIANVCFIIAFIVIIYSQLTSVGYSNYNLKDMIPRLVIAAALVNLSFWIAALAVDISNLLGHSIQAILVNIRENYTTGIDVSWGQVAAYVLSAGAVGTLGFAAAAGGSFASLGFILIAALISAAMAILVAFIILAARQAIITALVIVSPLAFVAFILPNTQSLFEKWRKSFTALLVFFPIFALLFGGAQLAGAAIINNANGQMHIVLIGMATQIVPLIVTPLLIRFSTGILGQVANMANNKSRGLVDRARNWATDNADYQKAKKIASSDALPGRGNLRGWLSPSQLGRHMDHRKRQRDAYKKDHEDYAGNRAERDRMRRINEAPAPPASGRDHRSYSERSAYRHREQMIRSHDFHEQVAAHKGAIDADGSEHWEHNLQHNPAYAGLRSHVRHAQIAQGRADVMKKDRESADDLELKRQIHQTPHLRQAAERTVVNTSEAGAYQEDINAVAEQTWKMRQHSDPTLRPLRTNTAHAKGIADVYEQSMANADSMAVKQAIQSNAALQTLAVTAGADAKQANLYQEAIDAVVEETWANRQKNDRTLRDLRTDAHHTKGRAKIVDERMAAADQRAFETLVSSGAGGYLQIRDDKQNTIRDTKHAQFQASQLEAEGERAFREDFVDGTPEARALRKQNVHIEQLKKESGTIANTLQKRADTHWEHVSRTDADVKALRLDETKATDSQRLAEAEWNTLVENVRALGDAAPEIDATNAAAANSIKNLTQDIAVQESALREAKEAQSTNLAVAYKESEHSDGALLKRAAGIGGREGEIRAYSKAWKQLVGEITGDVETARSITSDYSRDQLKTVLFDGADPDDPSKKVSEAVRQAAMYELVQKKGNNQDAQEIRDAIAKMGLIIDTDGKHYEAKRLPNGKLDLTKNGYPQIDYTREVTDPEEITNRRDWQQFFDDAASKSPHSMVTYSGTNKSSARSGNLVDDMRGGFFRDALGGKFGPDKIFKADIDELKSLYFDMSDPDGYYQSFDSDEQQKIRDTIEQAILGLQADKMSNPKIDDRNRGMMNELLGLINPDYIDGTTPDGKNKYPVDEDNAIIPPSKRATTTPTGEFVPPVEVKGAYYTDRTIIK